MDDNLANGDATMQPGQDVEVKFAVKVLSLSPYPK